MKRLLYETNYVPTSYTCRVYFCCYHSVVAQLQTQFYLSQNTLVVKLSVPPIAVTALK